MQLKPSHENYPEDVTRVQTAVINHGYECSRQQADRLWRDYSDSLCAGWIMMNDYTAEALWGLVEPFIESDE